MSSFLIRLVINMVALGVAVIILPGVRLAGEGSGFAINLFFVAIIFGLVNTLIKPILAIVTCPFYILTLGLFTFVVNALMLLLTDWLAGFRFEVNGFWWAFIASVLMSLVSLVMSGILQENKQTYQSQEIRR